MTNEDPTVEPRSQGTGDVLSFPRRSDRTRGSERWSSGSTVGGDGSGGGGDMEARLAKIEAEMPYLARDVDLKTMKATFEATVPHLATQGSMIRWVVGTGVVAAVTMIGAIYGAAQYIIASLN